METVVEVKFYGGFAAAAGTDSGRVRLAGSTLGKLLAQIRSRWPKVSELLDGAGKGSAVLILNGKALEPPDPDTGIGPGDVLSIMPFVAGG